MSLSMLTRIRLSSIKTYLIGVSKKIYDDPRFKRLPDIGGEDPQYGGPEFVRQTIKNAEEIGVPILKELGPLTSGK